MRGPLSPTPEDRRSDQSGMKSGMAVGMIDDESLLVGA